MLEPDTPFECLYIEDDGKGLGGETFDDSSDFFKFCLGFGDPEKLDDVTGTGGSYGYGKSVFSTASKIRAIFVYSVCRADQVPEGQETRLIGLSWLDKHKLGGNAFSGRGFFGVIDEGASEFTVNPFVGVEAHQQAEKLGFRLRQPDETGLSILVLANSLKPDLFCRSVETHWWPRIIDNTLQVKIETPDGTLYPRPKTRTDLVPYFQCFEFINQTDEPTTPEQKLVHLQAINEMKTGRMALVSGSASSESESEEDDEVDVPANAVALMRKPGMIIEYQRLPNPFPKAVHAVFKADDDADITLRSSEPPAHTHWDAKSERLSDAEKEFVSKLMKSIKRNFDRFRSNFETSDDAEAEGLKELERLLGQTLKITGDSPDPPSKLPDPIELRINDERREVGDQAQGFAEVRLRVKESHTSNLVRVIVNGRFQTLVDDNAKAQGVVPCQIHSVSGTPLDETRNGYHFELNKNEWLKIQFLSESYDPSWFVNFSLEIRNE